MSKQFPITDHALLRWLERVYGTDLDALRDQICTPGIRAAVKGGAASVTVGGFTYTIEGGTIVTIFSTKHDQRGARRYREIDDDA